MVRRIQKSRSRHEFEREERLASDVLGSKGSEEGLGTNLGRPRRNVAKEAHDPEGEDYEEENRNMLGEPDPRAKIKPGYYEEDYGPGVQGRREAGQVPTEPQPESRVLKTGGGEGEDREDFPTGSWQKQKVRATLKNAKGATRPVKKGPMGREGSASEDVRTATTGRRGSKKRRTRDASPRFAAHRSRPSSKKAVGRSRAAKVGTRGGPRASKNGRGGNARRKTGNPGRERGLGKKNPT